MFSSVLVECRENEYHENTRLFLPAFVVLCDCAVTSSPSALMRLSEDRLPRQKHTVYLFMCHREMCPCTLCTEKDIICMAQAFE